MTSRIRGDSGYSSILMPGLYMRLHAGEDPQSLVHELVDQVRERLKLWSTERFTPSDVVSPLKMLIAKGARVASSTKDCPYAQLAQIPECRAIMSYDVVSSILQNPGEVPLHIIAMHSPWNLERLLPLGQVLPRVEDRSALRDAKGCTPSHWLWDPDGLLARQARQAHPPEGPEDPDATQKWHKTIESAWKAQGLLERLGLGLQIPDNKGLAAMSLCADRIEAGHARLLADQPVCNAVRAHLQARHISRNTPPVSPSSIPLRPSRF